jgi:MFS family permease
MATSTSSDSTTRMTREEIRASASLASIFALRMLGLFLILPVFAIYAKSLPGGDNATLVGLAMGIYGLAQACFQLLFGIASDKYGRKPVIVFGLLVFAIGSFIAAFAGTLHWIIVGRAIQGAGAISAAITALIADSTRDEHRTKAMAMVGGSIGITFALSLIIAPLLFHWVGMSGIFGLTGILSLLAIGVILFVVPTARETKPQPALFGEVLRNRELLRLDYGVFVLHLTQLSVFVIVPSILVQYLNLPVVEHWKIYLPIMVVSFILMLPPIFIAEKQGKMKQVFVSAIGLLLVVQLGLWILLSQSTPHAAILLILILAFFIAFNILEASQPSLVSRIAPPAAKGAALGIYNTLQSLGLFCGGAVGGWLKQHVGASSVFLLSAVLTVVWLIIAANMKALPRRGQAAANAA